MGTEEYKAIEKIVFITIDPLIRLLLLSMEKLGAPNDYHTNDLPHEQTLAIYKNLIELYQQIQNEIAKWKEVILLEEDTFHYKKALSDMQKYYFLPILWTMQNIPLCIFRKTSTLNEKSTDQFQNDKKYTSDIMIRNAYLNTLEEAAKTLQSYLAFLYQQKDNQTVAILKSTEIACTSHLDLDPNLCLKMLVAITVAISNIRYNTLKTSDSLNTGDSCHQTLLSLVEDLLRSQGSSKVFTDLWKTAFQNRTFSESLVISCISALYSVESENIHSGTDLKGNLELKLQSLLTLESLLFLNVDHTIWMNYFPDIFMKLYQEAFEHVRFIRGTSSPRLASESIKVIALLMKKTLIVPDDCICDTNKKDFGQTLLSLSVGSIAENESHTAKLSSDLQMFFQNVHSIITKPLVLLLRMASSKPSKVVQEVLLHHLCDAILKDNLHCWNLLLDSQEISGQRPQTHEVIVSAFECIILGMNDGNAIIRSKSEMIFDDFLASFSSSNLCSWSKDTLLPRTKSCIETIPSLSRSGRETDLLSCIRLVTAYLKIFMIIGTRSDVLGKSRSHLRSFFASQLSTDEIRQCFVECFVMDNMNTIKYGLVRNTESSQSLISYSLRFFSDKSIQEMLNLIGSLSSLLGFTKTLSYIDTCVSDLFDAISSRINHQRFLYDVEHSRWMERYFGLGVLIHFLIVTIRKPLCSKRNKHMESLTKAILPILCSDVFWKLPSTFECALLWGASSEKSSTIDNIFRVHIAEVPIISTSRIAKSVNRLDVTNFSSSRIATDALVANGMLQSCLIDIITVSSSLLKENFNVFIPALLFPLLSKLSDLNSPLVRNTIMSAISSISNSAGYHSSEDMLSHHFVYLMEVMTTELKSPSNDEHELFSHGYCFYSLHSTIKYILDYDSRHLKEHQSIETKVILIADMLSSLGRWFNRNFRKNTNQLLRSVVVIHGILQLYTSAFAHINILIPKRESEDLQDELDDDVFKWESLLVEFRLDQFEDAKATGFEVAGKHVNTKKEDYQKVSLETIKKLIGCTDSILMINSLLVSIPDLRTQINSLALFRQIFELLASIQLMVKRNRNTGDDEIIDIGNPLLQQAHKYWIPFRAKLSSTVELYLDSKCFMETQPSNRHMVTLICHLIETVSVICQHCGDFIAGRFQKDIFPQISRVLQKFSVVPASIDGGNEDLILCIFVQVKLLFANIRIGAALQGIVPTLSSMILPFLANDGLIGDNAFEAFKTILVIDFDSSLRYLYSISGIRIPERELLPCEYDQRTRNDPGTNDNKTLQRRCLALISELHMNSEMQLLL